MGSGGGTMMRELANMVPVRNSQAFSDAQNVVHSISWSPCFSAMQWYKDDIRYTGAASSMHNENGSAKQQQQQQQQQQDGASAGGSGSGDASVRRRAVCTRNEKLVKSFLGISSKDAMWFCTYVSKAIAYMRVDVMLQERRRCCAMAKTPSSSFLWQDDLGSLTIIFHALRSIFHTGAEARLMSDVMSVASREVALARHGSAVTNASDPQPSTGKKEEGKNGHEKKRFSEKEDPCQIARASKEVGCNGGGTSSSRHAHAGIEASHASMYMHISCRLLELASLLEDMEEILAARQQEQGGDYAMVLSPPPPPPPAAAPSCASMGDAAPGPVPSSSNVHPLLALLGVDQTIVPTSNDAPSSSGSAHGFQSAPTPCWYPLPSQQNISSSFQQQQHRQHQAATFSGPPYNYVASTTPGASMVFYSQNPQYGIAAPVSATPSSMYPRSSLPGSEGGRRRRSYGEAAEPSANHHHQRHRERGREGRWGSGGEAPNNVRGGRKNDLPFCVADMSYAYEHPVN